jgi:hypothetical protein
MSKVEINFKIIHSTSSHTLLGGEINVTQPLPNSIISPPLCDFQDNHITLDRTVDKSFKEYFMKAPILPKSFTIYDQAGFTNTKYNKNRVNNNSGTIENEIEPRVLLSDIVLPTINDGQQFLIVTSYSGLTSRYLDEQKKYIVTNDLEMFKSKYDLSKVILFIVDTIYNEIIKYCDLKSIFKEVYETTSQKMIPSVVEFIAGSIVSGSKPDFQTFMSFGTNVEIVREYFVPVKNQLCANIRTCNRIHLATTFTISCLSFMILLSHSSPDDINITESTNETKFELIKNKDDVCNCAINQLQLQTVIDAILYLNELEQLKTKEEFTQFMYANSHKLVTYLIDSPILKMFKFDTSLEGIDLMSYNYMQTIQCKIYNKLVNHPLIDYGLPPHTNPIGFHRGGYQQEPPPLARQYTETSRNN